jgi:hypothetical protein
VPKRQTKEEKALDREIDSIYRHNCCNIPIDIFDIPKVFEAGRKAKAEGRDLKEAIVSFVDSIKKERL